MTSELKPIICPSVLASDLSCLAAESQRMVDAGCDWLHLDIMDGHFVPNLTIGPGVVKGLRSHLKSAFFDVHLMVADPEKWVKPFVDAGADSITFHWESVDCDEKKARELATKIRALGIKTGLAIKPGTPFADLGTTLEGDAFDMLLVMTVEPGFGGQSFMEKMLSKVETARSLFPGLNIQVDGGLDGETVKKAAAAGANVIVAGTSMFKAENPEALMTFMRDVGLSFCRFPSRGKVHSSFSLGGIDVVRLAIPVQYRGLH
ncbi:ribulose-phosphate 3 epimerase family protein [Besnoitia besnoiti]|uniref:Ribulose-phosphate 3-epimerase n=1 Tax=Besnoitia besnoiti TaxID=94643 RepID=A0A2A9MNQ2_BESBE|nr:ribulose-phosphate 3 epimerase family protein [Besnoitia besnoiti]PFH38211.1 ribulose-phosphate 3 epimerase family protein [Besnoitia besnoiti]